MYNKNTVIKYLTRKKIVIMISINDYGGLNFITDKQHCDDQANGKSDLGIIHRMKRRKQA